MNDENGSSADLEKNSFKISYDVSPSFPPPDARIMFEIKDGDEIVIYISRLGKNCVLRVYKNLEEA